MVPHGYEINKSAEHSSLPHHLCSWQPTGAGCHDPGHLPLRSILYTAIVVGATAKEPVEAGRIGSETAAACDAIKLAIALLDRWAHLDVIAAVCELTVERTAACLERLERSGVICGAVPARFSDSAVRAETIAAPTAPARALLHARIAEQLRRRGASDEEVGIHLLQAPGQDLHANVEVLRRCARDQLRQGRAEAAAASLERALREPPPEGEVPELLLELAGALLAGDRHADALCAARRARERAATISARADAELAIFRARLGLGEIEPALSGLVRQIDSLRERDGALALRLERGLLRYGVGEARVLEVALARYRANAADHSVSGRAGYSAHAHQVLAMGGATCAGQAVATVRSALSLDAVLDGDMETVVRSLWLLIRADKEEQARELLDQLRLRLAEAPRQPVLDAAEGLILLRWGSVAKAAAQLGDALALARSLGDALGTWMAAGFLGGALYEADRTAPLEQLLAEMDPDAQPESPFMALLRVARARHLLAAGKPAEALADLMAVEERKVALGLVNPAGFHHIEPAVEALLTLGEHARALELAKLNLERAEAWGAPVTVALARGALARCVAPREAADRLAEALALLPASRATTARAQLLMAFGQTLSAAGRPKEARGALREALDCAARIDAERISRISRAALLALGARPRRRHLHGPDALTPAERRVGALAASGLANREIAARLYLSVRTVENHLRHVYSKLDCDRAKLPEKLPGQSAQDPLGSPP